MVDGLEKKENGYYNRINVAVPQEVKQWYVEKSESEGVPQTNLAREALINYANLPREEVRVDAGDKSKYIAFTVRLTDDVRAMLRKRATENHTNPSAYVRSLIYKDLSL